MKLHSWDVDYDEARRIQERLREKLKFPVARAAFRRVAGADVAYDRLSEQVIAAIVVLDARTGQVVDEAHAIVHETFPYIPGLLSFREAPAVLAAWNNLHVRPELLLVDGQGVAHPRRFGLACHLGLWLNLPSLGCAKSRLIGEYREPGESKGSWSQLRDGTELVGAVLRTRNGVRPLYISQGYLLSLPLCIRLVLDWCRSYRLPEPARQAHIRVTAWRKRVVSQRNAYD